MTRIGSYVAGVVAGTPLSWQQMLAATGVVLFTAFDIGLVALLVWLALR